MAKVTLNFEVPHCDPTSENCARVKALLLHALDDMVRNNGHLIDDSRDYALGRLVTGQVTCAMVPEEEVEAALDAAARELAEDAEVL